SPEQLAYDLADSICRTGALVRPTASAVVVLNPEHARQVDKAGWSKQDFTAAIIERGVRSHRNLAAAGKDAMATGTRWRIPSGHPDAVPAEPPEDLDEPVRLLATPESVHIVVAGAPNAGVSSVVETFGPVDRPPAVTKVKEAP